MGKKHVLPGMYRVSIPVYRTRETVLANGATGRTWDEVGRKVGLVQIEVDPQVRGEAGDEQGDRDENRN